MSLGPHTSFIVTSYILTTVVVLALILWIFADYAGLRRILGDLDTQGVRRRSQADDKP